MAWWDEYDNLENSELGPWDPPEWQNIVLWDDSGSWDRQAADLFWAAYVDERPDALDELRSYMYDEYNIEWDEVFDWVDFREWYSAQ